MAAVGLRRIGGVHSLRHCHATHLLANGVPPSVVAHRLGDTTAVIEAVYSHWVRSADERAAAVWEQAVHR